jgi:hypothetical protein
MSHVAIVWVIPSSGRYKLMHHEVTKSFRNCNNLVFREMDTWWVRVLKKIKISNYAINQLSLN